MATPDRALSEVLLSILGNVEEIIRSEVRLARTEIREEAAKAKSLGVILGAGLVTVLYAALFLLLALGAGLALVLPVWASALTIGSILSIAGGLMVKKGNDRLKALHPKLERTAETIKETVEWVRQRAR